MVIVLWAFEHKSMLRVLKLIGLVFLYNSCSPQLNKFNILKLILYQVFPKQMHKVPPAINWSQRYTKPIFFKFREYM
jgi:hypothetical protein